MIGEKEKIDENEVDKWDASGEGKIEKKARIRDCE